MREAPDTTPAAYVTGGWPYGVLASDAPLSARLAQAIARNLENALTEEGLSDRRLAERADLTHPPIGRLLRGEGLPDMRTLLLLEIALQRPLWPAGLHEDFGLLIEEQDTPGVYPPGQEPSRPEKPVTTQDTRAILRLMATGLSHAEIAAELGIATRTVGKRLTPLYDALGISPGDAFRLALWWATSPEQHKT
ncbi:helix-turn-helix transcriptional regulator [Streptomyces jumonjinensis]|uniref:helix-turn-helix transcriptional regulator n=1 Tax=Streptomyces jumonjinensis TaxID=1945 RepID=UPI0037B6B46F